MGALGHTKVADAMVQCELRALVVQADRTDLVDRIEALDGGPASVEVGVQANLGQGQSTFSERGAGSRQPRQRAEQHLAATPVGVIQPAVIEIGGRNDGVRRKVTFLPQTEYDEDDDDHDATDDDGGSDGREMQGRQHRQQLEEEEEERRRESLYWLDQSNPPHKLGGSFMLAPRFASGQRCVQYGPR